MKYIYPILFFIPLALLQVTVIPFFSYNSVYPDLIGILIAILGFRNGKIYGMANGFFLGLLFDILTGGAIGLSSFSKTINGFMAGHFYKEERKDEEISNMKLLLIILISTSLDSFFYTFLGGSKLSFNVFYLLLVHGLIPGFYSAVFSLPILFFKEKI
ncbi:MAG: rod shape-determining protein MreD [Ignavibacteriae bacterium HGW-Ignavibacteriae-2]|nr:MAG: rod shape-determining protein MreD [Ignavibacteriae bacterium HGW-Ignavibacteriae-2]